MVTSMKCFVASVFGKKDVDEIFDKIIVPVLKEYSIQPLRVDRVEHNDDIDDKIFELMLSSDFCIADLTYARPSVYFEAGYIWGIGKPVIYLVRSDHFKPKIDDSYGNLKVHFDLQMKNIISWSEPTKALKMRFERRLSSVIKPIRHSILLNERRKNEEINFGKQSQDKRHGLIIENIKSALKKIKYNIPNIKSEIKHPHQGVIAYKKNKIVFALSRSTLTKKMLESLRWFLLFGPTGLPLEEYTEIHIIYILLKSIPQSRITEAYPDHFILEQKIFKSELIKNEKSIDQFIHVIDDIKSLTDLKNKTAVAFTKYL